MNKIKIFLLVLCFAPMALYAAEPGMPLDKAPIDTSDNESLQRGAQAFVNYCLTCHGASFMRYNRHRDIGWDNEAVVLNKLVMTGQKAGDLMVSAMRKNEGEEWFGVAPPDLSVIARSRGADWLYTYLRAFYRDDTTVPGWNNLVFDRAAMPHVLYEFQGEQRLVVKSVDGKEVKSLDLVKPGSMTVSEYDRYVADLVNYLVYIGEPIANERKRIGMLVMIFLFGMLGLTYLLYREYWRDIH
ncbi:MAG: cytochrome c1 [Nitrosomonas sp.]|nr:cytochrome c1 [Nitrosomonas sp.]MCP5252733.1 cytochrome c1 [Burkholderiales bacterium]MCP5292208.1 cytochrome c1 [Burkholderiales bacterium]HQU62889.1 cytochrome c1 [Nitrosomonas sp.]